jgi:hypothetical protein
MCVCVYIYIYITRSTIFIWKIPIFFLLFFVLIQLNLDWFNQVNYIIKILIEQYLLSLK